MKPFIEELKELINKHSLENHSNTPDFILANYLRNCFDSFNAAVVAREKWYGRECVNSERNEEAGEVSG